jgi:transglutaminase-like putative cysteine protease
MLVEFAGTEEVTYRLEQRLRYSYGSPVRSLRHRLMVVPRAVHGGQHRLDWGISVSGSPAIVEVRSDRFANLVLEVRAADVAEWIEFETWALTTRTTDGVTTLGKSAQRDRRWLAPTPLTRVDATLREVASELTASRCGALEFAERVCAWTHQAMTYGFGVTSVQTDAATALAAGTGVCQDYAHIMLALCRIAGVGARYVSGHMVGEGGSHAWVEVMSNDGGATTAVAFDPTHNRRVGRTYLTVAVGRDYSDVPPTSGTFAGTCPGELGVQKWLGEVGADEFRVAAAASS